MANKYDIDNEYFYKNINQDGVVPIERSRQDKWNEVLQTDRLVRGDFGAAGISVPNSDFIKDSKYNERIGNVGRMSSDDYMNALYHQ